MKRIFLLLFFIGAFGGANMLFAQSKPAKQWKVRGLYLSNGILSDSVKLRSFINLPKHSQVNTYVIDVKGVEGFVNYESKIPAVREAKAWSDEYDAGELIKTFHKNGIHVIGRIVCFNDPYISLKKTEWAIRDSSGQLYKSPISGNWLNPANREVWKYLVDIAKECSKKGFDEVQFDYVRFPTDGKVKTLDYGQPVPERHKVIDEFLAYARKQLPHVILSADVFGIICESVNDPEKIGQNLEYVGRNLDYISPMIYPSLFAKGQEVNHVIYATPDLEPYGVVFNTITNANNRIAKVKEGYRAKIRPYLQAYTASWLAKGDYQVYGPEQIKQQIKGAKDAGSDQWLFWNEDGNYPEAGFVE